MERAPDFTRRRDEQEDDRRRPPWSWAASRAKWSEPRGLNSDFYCAIGARVPPINLWPARRAY